MSLHVGEHELNSENIHSQLQESAYLLYFP